MSKEHMPTGLDDALKLEAVYYSHQVPRDLATLTVMGTVFDKVYFPDVYLPMTGFDPAALDNEILRIVEATKDTPTRDDTIIGVLKFLRLAKSLDGFCVFTGNGSLSKNTQAGKLVDGLYQAIHGPHRPGWTPMFMDNHCKGLPGSQDSIVYPGIYHYMSGAMLYSAQTGIPLLNDVAGLPVPLIEGGEADKAKHLSAMLAIECVKLALPALPILWPEDLMEFRESNQNPLRSFRRALLKYAADLNQHIANVDQKDLEAETKFFVNTEIVPALEALRATMNAPARPWYKRAIDAANVVSKIEPSFFTTDIATGIGALLVGFLPQFFTELTAIGDKHAALRKSGLYYLLQLETFYGKNSASD